jgi:hypothetical protein
MQNFAGSVTYTATASDASTQDYVATVTIPVPCWGTAGLIEIENTEDAFENNVINDSVTVYSGIMSELAVLLFPT